MRSKITYLGVTVQPLELSYKFYRDIYEHGRPATMVLGGSVTAKIEVNDQTMRFLEEMLSIDERCKNWDVSTPSDSEFYKKIVVTVYDDNGYNIRTLELLDSYIATFQEVFLPTSNYFDNHTTNNYVNIEFQSASQIINKGVTKNVFGWWITNPFEMDEYKSPVQTFENSEKYDEQLKIVDENGNPIYDLYYCVESDGKIVTTGRTDKNGLVKRIEESQTQKTHVYFWGDEALFKSQNL